LSVNDIENLIINFIFDLTYYLTHYFADDLTDILTDNLTNDFIIEASTQLMMCEAEKDFILVSENKDFYI